MIYHTKAIQCVHNRKIVHEVRTESSYGM